MPRHSRRAPLQWHGCLGRHHDGGEPMGHYTRRYRVGRLEPCGFEWWAATAAHLA
jgi:hypothetical protein